MVKDIIILHNRLNPKPTIDEEDVMIQVNLISDILISMDYRVKVMDIGYDIYKDIEAVENEKPDLVFNLVETGFNKGELLYIVPGLLKMKKIPYTGVPVEGLFITTNKVLAKNQMKLTGIPTPGWYSIHETDLLDKETRYLLKPTCEDGSVGLNDKAVYYGQDPELPKKVKRINSSHYFLEEYIHGREFSIGLLAGDQGPSVLPTGEIVFYNFKPEQPKILGYKAKWHRSTPEYHNTVREFSTIDGTPMNQRMQDISIKCWEVFGLKGYARVDFRVDEKANPYVIEINGNPCISPDSGYFAACDMVGISPQEIVERIINDTNF